MGQAALVPSSSRKDQRAQGYLSSKQRHVNDALVPSSSRKDQRAQGYCRRKQRHILTAALYPPAPAKTRGFRATVADTASLKKT
jgi:hypothetical protein